MLNERYMNQVRLLLRCLPEIDKQDCFALKGGTALNLFIRDVPRISVDIDLTYVPLKPREEALHEISHALEAICEGVKQHVNGCTVQRSLLADRLTKIHVTTNMATITIEPNVVLRGTVHPPTYQDLVPTAQTMFESFVSMRTVSGPDLFGGKLCAALDRQHPRDLFDIKPLLDNDGITPEIRRTFVVYLAGHPRPMSELLCPRLRDLDTLYYEQFEGMTRQDVSLEDLKAVQHMLPSIIRASLDDSERQFLLSIKKGEPDWDVLGLSHIRKLPALQWKLINIRQMAATKRAAALRKLQHALAR